MLLGASTSNNARRICVVAVIGDEFRCRFFRSSRPTVSKRRRDQPNRNASQQRARDRGMPQAIDRRAVRQACGLRCLGERQAMRAELQRSPSGISSNGSLGIASGCGLLQSLRQTGRDRYRLSRSRLAVLALQAGRHHQLRFFAGVQVADIEQRDLAAPRAGRGVHLDVESEFRADRIGGATTSRRCSSVSTRLLSVSSASGIAASPTVHALALVIRSSCEARD